MEFLITKNVILWGVRWLSENNYSGHNKINLDTAIQEQKDRGRGSFFQVETEKLHEVGAA